LLKYNYPKRIKNITKNNKTSLEVQNVFISSKEKRALRRLQADKMLTKTELAQQLGLTRKTLGGLLNNNEPQKVKNSTYQKIMRAIAENY